VKSERDILIENKLDHAQRTFEEVQFLAANKYWNTCVNRLYYTCFYVVSALLLSIDIQTKTHSGAKQLFSQHFIKTGIIDESYGAFYAYLFTMRQKADYDDIFDYEDHDVLPLIPLADDMIQKARTIVFRS